jgi:ParB family transcriptional regulator, chromosome partitioning protein
MYSQISSTQGLFQELLVKKLRASSNLVRDNLELIPQLAASIREKGLLQPIVVRLKDEKDSDYYYEIIAGYRRYEACRMLALSKMMCHIVDVDDKEAYEISLLENIQQESMNPIEEAKAFQRYVRDFGWGGESDLARRIGKRQEYISRRIQLLSLPADVQNEIMRHRMNVSVAQELLSIDNNDNDVNGESIEALNKYITENKTNSREVRQIVRVLKDKRQRFPDFLNSKNEPDLGHYYINSGINRGEDSVLEAYKKLSNSTFKKSILSVRIALKSIDIMLEELEGTNGRHDNDSYKQHNSSLKWIISEILRQHRLKLHDQIDILLRQQRKITKVIDRRLV